MEREQFLKTFGIGMALVCTGACFNACKKSDDSTTQPGTSGTAGNTASVDISTMAAIGNQTSANGVLFFRTGVASNASSFVATEALCPHQGGTLSLLQGNSKIQCSLHQATYSNTGNVLSGPTDGGSTRALKIYAVTLTGTTLTATKS